MEDQLIADMSAAVIGMSSISFVNAALINQEVSAFLLDRHLRPKLCVARCASAAWI